MENKTFLVVIGIIIAVIAGVLVLSNTAESPSSNNSANEALQVKETDHQKGAQVPAGIVSGAENEETEASVVLVEYGDFQCPACASVFPLVEQVVSDYEDEVSFVFRHYPLTQIHPNAMVAHRAAEAAAQQDMFFEMYEQLYTNQQQWSEAEEPFELVQNYAETIGLDMVQFEQDYNDPATLSRVNEDLQNGGQVGVSGTPTFFLNGEKIEIRSYEGIKQTIEDAISEAESDE